MSETNLLISKVKSPYSRSKRLTAKLGRFVPKPLRFAGKTIGESLALADSEEEMRELLRNGNEQRPSGRTRREWLRIANERRVMFSKENKTGEKQK